MLYPSFCLPVLSPSALNINIIFMPQVQPCTYSVPSFFLPEVPSCISSSMHRTSCEASCPLGAGLRRRHGEAPFDPGLTPSIPWEDMTDPKTGTCTRQFGVVGGSVSGQEQITALENHRCLVEKKALALGSVGWRGAQGRDIRGWKRQRAFRGREEPGVLRARHTSGLDAGG